MDIIIDSKKRNQFLENFKHESNIRLILKKLLIISLVLLVCSFVASKVSEKRVPVITFITELFGNPFFYTNKIIFNIVLSIGLLISFLISIIFDYKVNSRIEDYYETIRMDLLGQGVANVVFLPLVYLVRILCQKGEVFTENILEYKQNIKKLMIDSFGFINNYADFFIEETFELPMDELSRKIDNLNYKVEDCVFDKVTGKLLKKYKRNLGFYKRRFFVLSKKILNYKGNNIITYLPNQEKIKKEQEKQVYKKI